MYNKILIRIIIDVKDGGDILFTKTHCVLFTRGGAREGLGVGGYSPPSEEVLGSRRRKFDKINHEDTIFQSS